MEELTRNCMENSTVGSFCGCISADADADPMSQAFCNEANSGTNVTEEDLVELKMALMDKNDSCCDC